MATILMLVGPEYEDLEVWYPKLRLEAAGHVVPMAGLGAPHYTGKNGYPLKVDDAVEAYRIEEIDGIFAPGGWAPDKIRRNRDALRLVRECFVSGKLVGTICHGGWVLASAGILKGRRMTSTVGIRDDMVNAGAEWIDAPVVIDGNLISSRVPGDLPALGEALVNFLAPR